MPAPEISPHGGGVHIHGFGRSIQAAPCPESFNIFPLLRADAQEQRVLQAVDKIGGGVENLTFRAEGRKRVKPVIVYSF
jgi:hypothetical protein